MNGLDQSPAHPDGRNPVRIVIVSDVALFREGLSGVLARHPDVEVLAVGPPTESSLVAAAAAAERADVALVDASTVRASAFVGRLAALLPHIRTVAFAVSDEDEAEILACAEAGVVGFVPRTGSAEELVAALRAAARGEVPCPPRVAAVVFRRLATLANGRGPATGDRTLTERERQVAALIERGLSNKEIAVALGIEVPTVKNHVHHILEKLRVRRRAEAAALVRGRRRWSRPSPSRPSAPPPEI